jgi:hypothetical protein
MSRRSTLLAKTIKVYLDLMWFLLLAAGAVLAIATPFVILSAPEIEDSDIRVAVRFALDEDALSGSSPRSDEVVPVRVQGQGVLQLKSASRTVWAGFLLSSLVTLAAALVVLYQLRALFRSVVSGVPFTPDNARRARTVGWVVVAWQLIAPVAKYLVGANLVGELHIRGITLKPPIDFNPDALFLGMAILVLAEIFRRASVLQQEQALTV